MSSLLSLPLLRDGLFDLCFAFLARLLRLRSRRFSLFFPRLYLSLLEDLFLFFRLPSLEELESDDDDDDDILKSESESESESELDESVSLSEELSDSDE